MLLDYNVQKLRAILDDFYHATGVDAEYLRENGTFITHKNRVPNPFCRAIHSTKGGRSACIDSDMALLAACRKSGTVEIHVCHAGLVDAAVPIIQNGQLFGYIILGPMRSHNNFDEIKDHISAYPIHTEKMQRYFNTLPVYDSANIQSIANIAGMLARSIIYESIVKAADIHDFEQILYYIENNLTSGVSIDSVVCDTYVTKSTLFREFRRNYSCTPGEYINQRKVEYAKRELETGSAAVSELSARLGFSSSSYFSKVFRKYTGVTPTEYRDRRR